MKNWLEQDCYQLIHSRSAEETLISEIRGGFWGSDEIRNRSRARADAENQLPAAQRSFTQPPRAFTCRPN